MALLALYIKKSLAAIKRINFKNVQINSRNEFYSLSDNFPDNLGKPNSQKICKGLDQLESLPEYAQQTQQVFDKSFEQNEIWKKKSCKKKFEKQRGQNGIFHDPLSASSYQ